MTNFKDRKYVTDDGVTVFISDCKYCRYAKSNYHDGTYRCMMTERMVFPGDIDERCPLPLRYGNYDSQIPLRPSESKCLQFLSLNNND